MRGEIIMVQKWKTACPLNCYDVCGLIVTTEDNKVINIEGDVDHPITKGKICGKGKMIKDRIYHSNRLLSPLKKVNGEFKEISWEQAIDEISHKMQLYKEKYGATSILHSYDYSSGGLLKEIDDRFFNFFGGMTKVIGSLCWGAGIQGQLYDMGDSKSHDPSDIKNAKAIIVWGRNITNTNMHIYPYIIEAKERGAKLIVIDPIENNIAKEADLHVKIHPGMDGHLALAISKVIIEEGWIDKDFIENYSVGFNEFAKVANKINLQEISEEINIDESTIYDLARLFIENKPVTTLLGLGMQRYSNGGNTIRAIDALIAITGNIGLKGGGINYANLPVGRSFNWDDLKREDMRKEYRTFARPTQAEGILSATAPPIKMMFITRSNALTQLPNIKKTKKALEHVETKVVIDMFMTDTARLADYVLPTTSVFEEEDIYYGSMFHGIVRYGPKIIDPPGKAQSDLTIWTELAKSLNLQGFEKSIEEYFELAFMDLKEKGILLEDLKAEQQINLPINEVPWENKDFSTPSGKFEFYSKTANDEGLNPTAELVYPSEVYKGKHPYKLLTIHPKGSLHSQHYFLLNKKVLPTIYLSKEIAEHQRLVNGDRIIVFNDRGKVTGYVKIENGSQKDTIVIEEGNWNHGENSVNKLTLDNLSDMGKGSVLYDCAVSVTKL